jgi:exosome complex component MTR3
MYLTQATRHSILFLVVPSQIDCIKHNNNNCLLHYYQFNQQDTLDSVDGQLRFVTKEKQDRKTNNMPRRPARLSNCYVPQVLPSSNTSNTTTTNNINSNINNNNDNNNKNIDGGGFGGDNNNSSISHNIRRDQREHDQLRQVVLETSVIGPALGSSLVELGHTKVLCEVHMVSSVGNNNNNNNSNMVTVPQRSSNIDSIGRLHGIVQYAPHIGMNQISQRAQAVGSLNNINSNNNNTMIGGISFGKMNQQMILQETALSNQLMSALLPVISLEKYPKCTIVIQATVLQDNGSCLSAVITAATLALVDARVELLDLVTSCTVAVMVQQQQHGTSVTDNKNHDDDNNMDSKVSYLVDPVEEEILAAQTIICLAMTPNHKEITLWNQSGKLSGTMVSDAMNLCRDGCRTYHKLLREFWIAKTLSGTLSV